MVASRLCFDPGQVLVDTVFTQGQQIRFMTALSLCQSRITTQLLCNGWLVRGSSQKGGLRQQNKCTVAL